jgi:transposase
MYSTGILALLINIIANQPPERNSSSAGVVDAEIFRSYVAQVLGPTLEPGDIVVMDNLAVHKVAGIAEAIESRSARLEFLPPYSLDLNPIEQCWVKIKTALRHAQARTRQALEAALKQALHMITPQMPRPGLPIVVIHTLIGNLL